MSKRRNLKKRIEIREITKKVSKRRGQQQEEDNGSREGASMAAEARHKAEKKKGT
jgi:hypothetical protein